MTALAADRDTRWRFLLDASTYPVKAATLIYDGSIVALDSAGNACPATDLAARIVVGVSSHRADNSSGAAGDIRVEVRRGVFDLNKAAGIGATSTYVNGARLYVVDDNTVGVAGDASNFLVAGYLRELDVTTGRPWVAVGMHAVPLLLTGLDAKTYVDSALVPAIDNVFVFAIADAAAGDDDFVIPFKCEVIDVWLIKNAAGAGNTTTVKNGATAITDAMAAAVDKTVTRAGTIDPASAVIAAGGTLRISHTRAAGSSLQKVHVRVIPRA